ncbi:hypothetical protein LZ656_21920 [Leclercia adecarboxylata]|uniref:hypothetical protein n=1 Tax=Leclercia adecarboxylata TaxID=83655 RepID=UPI001F30138F|nr:hypothetical protein [Leclercia adecarboxylata]MCE9985017.1 hypothetical protein [Leclercia adecarboxylata]MDU1985421.1 hypothetical protein [Streptococcus parasanguinis]
MNLFPYDVDFGVTTNPVEAEVSSALAKYKIALIHTGYRNIGHRVLCFLKDKDAMKYERLLINQEKLSREIVNRSGEHQDMLRFMIEKQTEENRKRDNFIHLLDKTKSERP